MRRLHQELRTNEREREAEFKGILTADQFQAFLNAKQQLVERRLAKKTVDD
jgi:hypothetical protein